MSEAPESDRALLDRLLPGWGIRLYEPSTYLVTHDSYMGPAGSTPEWAIDKAARTLRFILARDRETGAEATPAPAAPDPAPATPTKLRRWPIGAAGRIFVANDGTLWLDCGVLSGGKWQQAPNLPQPGEEAEK